MPVEDGDLITGRSSHEIYLVEDGRRRWVPDSWTLNALGRDPSELRVISDADLLAIPKGDAIESEVPPAPIVDGEYYETESGVFVAKGGKLVRVLDPSRLKFVNGFDSTKVTYLPDSVVRRHHAKQIADPVARLIQF
jgi:hypothetical protein